MTRKRHTPVVSFGPKLMALLLSAAVNRIERQMPWNDAVRLRQRAYMLRTAMKDENHSQYPIVSRVRITINTNGVPTKKVGTTLVPVDPRAKVQITFAPNDSEFDTMLGAFTTAIPNTSPSDDTETSNTSTDLLEDILKDIT